MKVELLDYCVGLWNNPQRIRLSYNENIFVLSDIFLWIRHKSRGSWHLFVGYRDKRLWILHRDNKSRLDKHFETEPFNRTKV